ncbi:MAG: hypothetical protein JNJ49_15100 [Bdellovibrionaceae bacterium]|nr:hypothetical protein [Pseudobdellovibrionaceae bacterium]
MRHAFNGSKSLFALTGMTLLSLFSAQMSFADDLSSSCSKVKYNPDTGVRETTVHYQSSAGPNDLKIDFKGPFSPISTAGPIAVVKLQSSNDAKLGFEKQTEFDGANLRIKSTRSSAAFSSMHVDCMASPATCLGEIKVAQQSLVEAAADSDPANSAVACASERLEQMAAEVGAVQPLPHACQGAGIRLVFHGDLLPFKLQSGDRATAGSTKNLMRQLGSNNIFIEDSAEQAKRIGRASPLAGENIVIQAHGDVSMTCAQGIAQHIDSDKVVLEKHTKKLERGYVIVVIPGRPY